MIPPRPKKVEVLENYKLKILFDNGEQKIYDMEKNIKEKFYRNLENSDYFKTVKVSGITLEWENGEDIDPNELYENSIILEQ